MQAQSVYIHKKYLYHRCLGLIFDFCRSRYNFFAVSGLLIYRVMLDFVYCNLISRFYSMFTCESKVFNITLSWIITILMIIPIIKLYRQNQVSSIIVLCFNMAYFLPMQTLYSFSGLDSRFYFSAMLYWAILMVWQLSLPIIIMRPFNINIGKIYATLAVCASLFIIIIFVRYTDCNLILDINEIYKWRTAFLGKHINYFILYPLACMPSVLSILALYYLNNRLYIVSLLLFGIVYVHFSISGQRTTFFLIFFCLIFYFIYKEYMISWFPWFLSALGVFTLFFEYELIGSRPIFQLFFRRIIFLTIKVSEMYFDYFTHHHIDLMRYKVLQHIGILSPYTSKVPTMIGWLYFNRNINANNGMVGDAFFAFGYFGMLIMPIIIILCLRIFDFCANSIDKRVLISFCIYYSVFFINVNWIAASIIHGYLVACLIFIFWPCGISRQEMNAK